MRSAMDKRKEIPAISLDEARDMLPKLGETLHREPLIMGYGCESERAMQECVVTYVNRAHLWYEVKFKSSGIKQGFKAIEPKCEEGS